VVRIIAARQPAIFVLENVKNLKSHDQGRTFRIIMQTLDELGMRWPMPGIPGRMTRR
jgi:DNA (cytosine-5)-methyltransferase 1